MPTSSATAPAPERTWQFLVCTPHSFSDATFADPSEGVAVYQAAPVRPHSEPVLSGAHHAYQRSPGGGRESFCLTASYVRKAPSRKRSGSGPFCVAPRLTNEDQSLSRLASTGD
jgi:hypothetical protein